MKDAKPNSEQRFIAICSLVLIIVTSIVVGLLTRVWIGVLFFVAWWAWLVCRDARISNGERRP